MASTTKDAAIAQAQDRANRDGERMFVYVDMTGEEEVWHVVSDAEYHYAGLVSAEAYHIRTVHPEPQLCSHEWRATSTRGHQRCWKCGSQQ